MRQILAVAAFGVIALSVCGPAFLTLWLRDAYSAEVGAALRWLAPTMALFAIQVVPWNFAETRGAARANIVLTALWLVGILALAPFFIPARGAEGLAIARLAVMGILPIYIVWIEHNLLGGVQKRLWFGSIWRLAIAALASGAVMHVILVAAPTAWVVLIAAGTAGLVTFCVLVLATRHLTPADWNAPSSLVPLASRS
jgi:hypothetical protein